MPLPSLHSNSKRSYVPVWDLHNAGSLESWDNGLALCRSHMDTYKFLAATEGRQTPESWIHDGLAHCSYIVSSVCTSPLCRQNTVPGRRRCVRSTGTLYRYAGFWTAHCTGTQDFERHICLTGNSLGHFRVAFELSTYWGEQLRTANEPKRIR